MITSPHSPPIGHEQENMDNQSIDNNNFVSHKSIPKIERAVKKIRALNENTAKHNNPQVVFLDSDDPEYNQEAMKAIEAERERIKKEQANLISIIPAPQHNTQDTNKDTSPTGANSQHNNNIPTVTQQGIEEPTNNNHTTEKDTQQNNTQNIKTDNNELQLECSADLKIQPSVTISTTSQNYNTQPLSPGNDEISNPNTEELQEVNESL